MAFDKDFNPVLRFTVVSDIHYQDEDSVERARMKKAIETSYALSEKEEYSRLDALYVVGDFATRGSEEQMLAFKATLDENLKEGTKVNLSLASHEFFAGEEVALERFGRIFSQQTKQKRTQNIPQGHFSAFFQDLDRKSKRHS